MANLLLLLLLLLHGNATHRYVFVGLRQHSNEHVDEHDHHTPAVRSKHEFSDKLRQVVSLVDRERVNGRQTVDGEVQRLNNLEQAANIIIM